MLQRSIYLFFIAIACVSSLKIPIVDEDYVDILIGTPPQKMRLLIDLVAPFSYIQKKFNSKSKTTENESFKYSNIFGNFTGEWSNDFFYITEDKYLPLKMRFLMVTESTTQFSIDGVLGLGYSKNIHPDCSLYANLAKMSGIIKTTNVLSYDKTKKLLTVGELPEKDNYNPVTFPIFEGPKNDSTTYVNLTAINCKEKYLKNSTMVDVHGFAKLGLMPVIIAPLKLKNKIETEYNVLVSNQTFTSRRDSVKFYWTLVSKNKKEDIISEIIFGKIAYKFDHTIKTKDEMISNIRINANPNIDFWYIGVDNLNVQRADFNFNNNTVTLYSPTAYDILGSKTYILFSYVLFGIAISIVIAVLVRTQCQKKRKNERTKEEQGTELI